MENFTEKMIYCKLNSIASMAFQLRQSIYDMKLNVTYQRGISNRIKNLFIKILFDHIKKDNPFIETRIGKFLMKLPFSHQLPFILRESPYYSTNLVRISKIVQQKYHNMTFIDIGANIGDSVALLRTELEFPILCVEGDNYFFSILQENTKQFLDVSVVKNYVGEQTIEVNAVSIELGGTAHISHDNVSHTTLQIKKLSAILTKYPLFLNSKILKIDTDGFDNKILRGSVDFLNNAKPIIFFEYDPFFLSQQNDDGLSIFDTLLNIGYRTSLIYENNGELLVSADLNNKSLLEDINNFYSGRKSLKYCDICVFHEDDVDLFNIVRQSEISFFKNHRK